MARMVRPLTDKEIKGAKAKEKEYKLFDGGGLYLSITPKGKKWWRLKYSFEGKEKRISLGVYPAITLQMARKQREELKYQISQGINPSEERKELKEIKKEEESKILYTFEHLSNEYFQHIQTLSNPISDNHHKKQTGRIANHCTPYIGSKPIVDLKKQDILEVIKRIKELGTHETARRVLSLIKSILEYGVDRELLEYSVASSIKPSKEIGKKIEKHYPVITEPKALKALLLAIDEYSGDYSTKQALRVMPHVALRAGNIRFAEWSEIDFASKLWKIPAEKMKMKVEHIIPLTDTVLKILKETKNFSGSGQYIFPSIIHKDRPLSENTLNVALRRLGYTKEEMVSHSFRGIFSTILHEKISEHGFDPLIIEMQLAHKEQNQVKAAYNHAKYLDDRIKLMEWWSGYLNSLKVTK
jgi:integrase